MYLNQIAFCIFQTFDIVITCDSYGCVEIIGNLVTWLSSLSSTNLYTSVNLPLCNKFSVDAYHRCFVLIWNF